MIEVIEPQPKEYPKYVDYLAYGNLQTHLDKRKRKLYVGKFSVGQKIAPYSSTNIKTGNFTVSNYDSHLQQTTMVFGTNSPNTDEVFELKEEVKAAQDIAGTSNIKIETMGIIDKIPQIISSHPELDGANNLFHIVNAIANHSSMYSRNFGIKLPNPLRGPRNKLKDVARKFKIKDIPLIRSILTTKYLIDDQHIGRLGWRNIINTDIPKLYFRTISKQWHRDVARPTDFKLPIVKDGKATMYMLEKQEMPIIL